MDKLAALARAATPEWHCPFCDATEEEVEKSIRNYGLLAPNYCEFCKRKHPCVPSEVPYGSN